MSSIIALDIGEKRVGVAVAEAPLYFAKPLTTLDSSELSDKVNELIQEHDAQVLVIGYPRNQAGQATAQSKSVEEVVSSLELPENVKIAWQDESLTSFKAEAELEQSGKVYKREEVDALAATYILEDYVKVNRS